MSGDKDTKPAEPEAPEPREPGGDSLQDASDEMVRFLEDTDEHHAGRGDYG